MAPPFRRKSKGNVPDIEDDDEITEVIEAVAPESEILEEISDEKIEEIDLELALIESAKRVTNTCMDIRRGENVLIVCDPTTGEIGQALHRAATERSDRVLLIVMPKSRHHGEEPPAPVANLMRQQQIVIVPTRYSLTHTRAIRSAVKEGARVATMPGMTPEMFINGGITADFNQIKKNLSELSSTLRRKRLIHVKDSNGTDVEFEVSWRDWELDDNGICNRPRMITNLPAGKAFVLPKEGTMNGTIIIDGTWESTLLEEPLELVVLRVIKLSTLESVSAESSVFLMASLNSSSITVSSRTSVAPLRGLNFTVGVIESIAVKVIELAVLVLSEVSSTVEPIAT